MNSEFAMVLLAGLVVVATGLLAGLILDRSSVRALVALVGAS
jgi:hypothetical protein